MLFLTARVDEADQIVGLEIGADEYVTKPFSPRVVAARVRALLRRVYGDLAGDAAVWRVRDLEVNAETRLVTVRGQRTDLTPSEFGILQVLVARPGQQSPGGQRMAQAGRRFTEQINAALAGVGIVAALLALAAGIFLSYTLARPLQRLADRIRPLTASHIGEQVPVEGPTEVRALAAEFNGLSQRLGASEQQRQQMSSDAAHELRTPVTVLRGHLEAMMDGVYPLDMEHLAVAYDQTIHLARLLEDLRLLTQAEAGRLELNPRPLAVNALVDAAVARFAPMAQDAGIAVSHAAAPDLPRVCVDGSRMQQVFDNLLANALRHTPAGGEIAIKAAAQGQYVAVVLANPGTLAPDELEHIFDRFWRADAARERDTGGSGLGPAITRQLVVLQHGEVRAEAQNGTISFVLDLPVAT